MTQPADGEGYYHCFSRESFITTTSVDTNCDIKQSTDDGNEDDDKKGSTKLMSAPCTAVKFIPRVLLTKKQDETEAIDTTCSTDAAVPSTTIEMDITEEK